MVAVSIFELTGYGAWGEGLGRGTGGLEGFRVSCLRSQSQKLKCTVEKGDRSRFA